jgi:hypothetical protein
MNSSHTPSAAVVCRIAAATSSAFTTIMERSITPRLQKFGNRMPVPV